jgi:purine nucleosidase
VNPEFFTVESGCVRVATDGMPQGQTMMNRRAYIDYPQAGWGKDQPLTDVCMEVNAQACLDVFERTMMSDWLTP